MSTLEPHATAAVPTDRLNTLSIVGFVLALVANVVGLVVSVVALVQISRTGERGRGLAITGIIVGGFWIALFATAFLVHFVVGAVHGA